MTMIEQHACVCGFPLMETPAFPRLFSYRWHVMHKKVHLANYPDVDWVTRGQLDALIEMAREKELVNA